MGNPQGREFRKSESKAPGTAVIPLRGPFGYRRRAEGRSGGAFVIALPGQRAVLIAARRAKRRGRPVEASGEGVAEPRRTARERAEPVAAAADALTGQPVLGVVETAVFVEPEIF